MIRRRRWIQPEFFRSEDVLALPRDARLTFIGLWLYADDYGRERTHAALIKADVWPLDEDITVDVVEEHLVLLSERGMLEIYAVGGREYFQLTGWDRWQPVQNPSRSTVPPPPALQHAQASVLAPATSTETPRSEGESGGERERAGESEWASERGGEAGTSPAGPAHHSPPPSPFCPKHPDGTTQACKGCANTRMKFKHWQAQQAEEESS